MDNLNIFTINFVLDRMPTLFFSRNCTNITELDILFQVNEKIDTTITRNVVF